ncbi:MAG TPA: hypothetical protein VFW27_03675 [Actinoplanes sp.]|nr:hypothetical protein [Actinoplanes sp.]
MRTSRSSDWRSGGRLLVVEQPAKLVMEDPQRRGAVSLSHWP